jgi:hypothetical protein
VVPVTCPLTSEDRMSDTPSFDLTEHVLGLLGDDRARWGWATLVVVEPDDPRWPGGSLVRLDAGGLTRPLYQGSVDIDASADARTVVFTAVDQRAPHEQTWTPEPDEDWWEALAADHHFECAVRGITGGVLGGAERAAIDDPARGDASVPSTRELAGMVGVRYESLQWREDCIRAMRRRR